MSIKKTTEAFYQIPKSLLNEPKIKSDHLMIFMFIHDDLRQREFSKKTNEELCELARTGLSQLKTRLNELEAWGFINRIGFGAHRKIIYGEKYYNRPETNPVQNENRPEINPVLAGNQPTDRPESNLVIYKNIYKNLNKKDLIFLFEKANQIQRQELNILIKNEEYEPNRDTLIILKPLLDKYYKIPEQF